MTLADRALALASGTIHLVRVPQVESGQLAWDVVSRPFSRQNLLVAHRHRAPQLSPRDMHLYALVWPPLRRYGASSSEPDGNPADCVGDARLRTGSQHGAADFGEICALEACSSYRVHKLTGS